MTSCPMLSHVFKRLSLQLRTFFEKFFFLFKSFVKAELSYFFTINLFTLAENCMEGKVNYLIKTGVFSLVCNYLRPSNNYRQSSFNINAVVLILIVCKDLRNW